MREERRSPLLAAKEGSGGHNLSFCLIRRGEKLDRPVAAAVTHLRCLFKGGERLESLGSCEKAGR